MSEQAIKIPCRACHGTGRIPLPYGYRETLTELGRKSPLAGGWWRVKDLAVKLGIQVTACNNRLAALEHEGLAERADFGTKDQRWRPNYSGIARACNEKGAR